MERKAKKKDFYKILGVSKEATDAEIRKAYRKLALQWHPDKNNETPEKKVEAEKKFKEIGEAYTVLSDKQKRQQYDLGAYDPDGGAGLDFSDFAGGFGGGFGGGIDPRDIFKQFF